MASAKLENSTIRTTEFLPLGHKFPRRHCRYLIFATLCHALRVDTISASTLSVMSPKDALSMSRNSRQDDAMGELDEPSIAESPIHERVGDGEVFASLDPSLPGEDAHQPPKKMRKRRGFVWLLGLAALMIAEQNTSGPEKHQAPPVPVTIAEVSQRDVPIYLDGLGTVQASNTVAVHSQVDGKLQSVNFVEGQRVRAGDVLAVVDPRPFQAALDQAKAKKTQDEAQLVSDAKDLGRFQDLVKKGAGTQQAVDQQQAKVDALNATIASDQAGIENAETQLSYATITAPINGRVGFRQVDAGNIVHAGDQTPITVLTDLTPTMVIFTLPQRDLPSAQEAMAKGEVRVVALDQDNTRELGQGQLLLIDNQIDQTTSTIRLKASFPNQDERLWPGEFIHARVLVETLKDAVTIPSAAVQRNSQGLLAWVIKTDGTAENRPIQGGPTQNDMTVVESGLKPRELVVVSGQYRLKPGVKVQATPPQAPAAETIAP
jgi:membrane fusion protein, multidrug efflux system